MRMNASVYAVIANGTERLADFDTGEEAEDRARAEAQYGREGDQFEVRLLDRRKPVLRKAPVGIECFLRGATAAERERCMAIYS